MIIDNFAEKCHVAITIIDTLKIVLSDNDKDKNLSIIIADNAHHWRGDSPDEEYLLASDMFSIYSCYNTYTWDKKWETPSNCTSV